MAAAVQLTAFGVSGPTGSRADGRERRDGQPGQQARPAPPGHRREPGAANAAPAVALACAGEPWQDGPSGATGSSTGDRLDATPRSAAERLDHRPLPARFAGPRPGPRATGATGATAANATTTALSPAAIAANLATAQAAVATEADGQERPGRLGGTKLYASISGTVASISGAVGSAVTAGARASESEAGSSGSGSRARPRSAARCGRRRPPARPAPRSATGFIVIARCTA